MKKFRLKWLSLAVCALMAFVAVCPGAKADFVYLTDSAGSVGRYDTSTGTGSAVGSLTTIGVTPNNLVGMAYQQSSNRLLLLDRGAGNVYAMDATTGISSLLFSPGFAFQGGAVVGDLLYGTDENGANRLDSTVEAFSLSTFADQNLSAAGLGHTHGVGVNSETGQLYGLGYNTTNIFAINADGSMGATQVTTNFFNADDVDYLRGDFLVVERGITTVERFDGTTGAQSTFLTAAQVSAMGVGSSSIAGVVVMPTPEPGTMMLMGIGLSALAGSMRHKKQGKRNEAGEATTA